MNVYESRLRPDGTTFPPVTPDPPPPPGYVDPIAELDAALEDLAARRTRWRGRHAGGAGLRRTPSRLRSARLRPHVRPVDGLDAGG